MWGLLQPTTKDPTGQVFLCLQDAPRSPVPMGSVTQWDPSFFHL